MGKTKIFLKVLKTRLICFHKTANWKQDEFIYEIILTINNRRQFQNNKQENLILCLGHGKNKLIVIAVKACLGILCRRVKLKQYWPQYSAVFVLPETLPSATGQRSGTSLSITKLSGPVFQAVSFITPSSSLKQEIPLSRKEERAVTGSKDTRRFRRDTDQYEDF